MRSARCVSGVKYKGGRTVYSSSSQFGTEPSIQISVIGGGGRQDRTSLVGGCSLRPTAQDPPQHGRRPDVRRLREGARGRGGPRGDGGGRRGRPAAVVMPMRFVCLGAEALSVFNNKFVCPQIRGLFVTMP